MKIKQLYKKCILLIFVTSLGACGDSSEKAKTVVKKKEPVAVTNKKIDFQSLKIINQKTHMAIGKINGKPISSIKMPFEISQDIVLNGWAIDKQRLAPATAVFVLVNGMPFKANYGFGRNDVAVNFKKEELIPTGFNITIPYNKIPNGNGVIRFAVVSSNGDAYYSDKLNYGFKYSKK